LETKGNVIDGEIWPKTFAKALNLNHFFSPSHNFTGPNFAVDAKRGQAFRIDFKILRKIATGLRNYCRMCNGIGMRACNGRVAAVSKKGRV